MVTFRKVPVTNNPGRFNICSDEPDGSLDFTCYASMVEEPQASKVLTALQGAESAALAEREACAAALYEESRLRAVKAKMETTVNLGFLREIESSMFRWAAQIVENPKIRARRE